MAKKNKMCYSGVGGQAVLEGVMMKNKDRYAVAVRKPNGKIVVEIENYQGILKDNVIQKIPFVRGVFNFIDSLVLGTKSLNYSASFYEEEEEETKFDKFLNKITKGKGEEFLTTFVMILSIVLAVGIFIVLPYFISSLIADKVGNDSMLAIIEGIIRIAIFILYVWAISLMKDIRRLYRYHGAEHKCINCIESGKPLTVRNAMRSSRLHKRCGTSFLFFVMFVSIILFFFIRVENVFLKVLLRVALMPVVAGISYEIIRLAGRSNNIIVRILSAPGMLIQRMTTKEPDRKMVEVAIAAVEAVFDWKEYLKDNFGYQEDAEDADADGKVTDVNWDMDEEDEAEGEAEEAYEDIDAEDFDGEEPS